jgi:hypothetical protein
VLDKFFDDADVGEATNTATTKRKADFFAFFHTILLGKLGDMCIIYIKKDYD